MNHQSPTLFVSIASYRDSECPQTLADLFAKAAHPERVQVGVLWQVAPEDDPALTVVPSHREQVRGEVVEAATSMGVCWARHRIQAQFWQGQAYYLQIDSHSRFDPGWDDTLIAMLAACPSRRAVLSTHPNAYHPPDQLKAQGYPILTGNRFNDEGILIPKGKLLGERPPAPLPSAFVGGGFLFGPGSLVEEVPYDPFLYFHGEEISLATRLWTHGYDLFSPNGMIIYHDYTDRGRRRHWSDHVDWGATNRLAMNRLRHLLGIENTSDPQALTELDRHGLGQARTLAEYQAYADINFRQRHIGPRARDGRFPPPPPSDPDQRAITRCFGEIFQNNTWKSPETRSGPGSTRKATALLRESFRTTLAELGVRILVDAGCGDLNWLHDVTERLELYLGFDLVEELVAENRVFFAPRKNHFFNTADITRERLPRGDALLCRHTLTHLPNPLALAALRLFKQSEARHLLATTYPGRDNREIQTGQWRPMDLTAPPFNLPPPRLLLPDGDPAHGCFLGVWKLADW